MQLFLGADGVKQLYELDANGFNYGRCKRVEIVGNLLEIQLFIIPNLGIHALTIIDEASQHVFPTSTTSVEAELKSFKFSKQDPRPIGIQGKFNTLTGLTSLGMFTMDPNCTPKFGEYVPIVPPKPNIVYIELPAKVKEVRVEVEVEKEKDSTTLIVVLIVVPLVLFCIVNVLLCRFYIRRYKNRV